MSRNLQFTTVCLRAAYVVPTWPTVSYGSSEKAPIVLTGDEGTMSSQAGVIAFASLRERSRKAPSGLFLEIGTLFDGMRGSRAPKGCGRRLLGLPSCLLHSKAAVATWRVHGAS